MPRNRLHREALGIADQIVAGTESDTVQVGSSGALGVTITDAARAGAGLVDVSAGSAAETAGLEAGDVVTAADGTKVTDAADLSELIQSLDPGVTVALEWMDTSGAAHSATVELGTSTVN